MAKEIPAVSVIVPMYNVEQYIGELLDSVFAQTLTNFELIIVDDCSTDNSCEIVESYIPKFDGRLRLIRSAVNSGGCAVPRNKGLEISRGEYIFFMDSDDLITKTALEEMYSLAVKFQADVVHCDKMYMTVGVGEEIAENMRLSDDRLCDQPVLLTGDLAVRMNHYLNFKFRSTVGMKLLRRDFLAENEIVFIPIIQEDVDWTLRLVCLAKTFLVVPKACYIVRSRGGSITKSAESINHYVRKWGERVVIGTELTDKFMSGLDFFKANPEYRYAVLNFYAAIDFNTFARTLENIPSYVLHEVLKDVFATEMGDNSALIAYLFSNSVKLTRDLIIANQKLTSIITPSHSGN